MSDPQPKRRQIGLFGGSFNPPHLCHTMTALWALQTHPIDEVWWMPTYQHAFGKALLPFEDRLALCELATRYVRDIKICDIERRLGKESRTIDTVQALQIEHPDADFWLIVGTDILAERHKWKSWDGLMALVRLIVVGRAGYGHEPVKDNLTEPGFVLPQISSTAIRAALADGATEAEREQLADWVDRQVLDTILERGWYRG